MYSTWRLSSLLYVFLLSIIVCYSLGDVVNKLCRVILFFHVHPFSTSKTALKVHVEGRLRELERGERGEKGEQHPAKRDQGWGGGGGRTTQAKLQIQKSLAAPSANHAVLDTYRSMRVL